MDWNEREIPGVVNVEEDEYHDMNYCSYSTLSKISKSGYRALQEQKIESKALNLGSFIDCYLLTPQELSKRFVAIQQEPTASLKVLADYVIENYESVPDNLYELSEVLGLWTKNSQKVVELKFTEEYINYLKKAIDSKDKEKYTPEDLDLAIKCEAGLKSNEITNFIFNHEDYGLDEIFFQTQGIFELEDSTGNTIPIKFMVDILTISHSLKRIYLYDLKTGMEPVDKFEISFLKYRYDIQHYIYTKGIEAIKNILGYKDYEVTPLQFIYISKIEPNIPTIYKVPEDLTIFEGYTTKRGTEMKGVDELLQEYLFYCENPNTPRRLVQEGPILTLDI